MQGGIGVCVRQEDCEWLREADRLSDPQGVSMGSTWSSCLLSSSLHALQLNADEGKACLSSDDDLGCRLGVARAPLCNAGAVRNLCIEHVARHMRSLGSRGQHIWRSHPLECHSFSCRVPMVSRYGGCRRPANEKPDAPNTILACHGCSPICAAITAGLYQGVHCALRVCCSAWLLSRGQGAWTAISVVGAAETPAAYTGQPHGR